MRKTRPRENFLLEDVAILVLSVFIAIFIIRTDVLKDILSSTVEMGIVGSFVSGMFFTSIFTTTPAIAVLGQIATHNSLLYTSFFGAIGALVGDLFIFHFVRDRLSLHLTDTVKHNGLWKKIKGIVKFKYFRFVTFLIGGLVLASPLPDELGIGLMGLLKMKMRLFIFLSFSFNFLGILIIGLIARGL